LEINYLLEVVRLKKVLVDEFREQLTIGASSNAGEATLAN